MDDQDITVANIYTTVDGPLVMLECGWCGHRWQTRGDCSKLRGYRAAEDERRVREG